MQLSTSEYRQESIDLLDEATTIVNQQQEQFRALNDQAKSLFKQWAEEQEQLRSRLQAVTDNLAKFSTSASNSSSSIELAVLKEEEQALRQRYLWVSERLASLQHVLQRLRWLARQAEISVQFIHTESDPFGQEEGQVAKLARMRALQAEEVERQRLAREIHDGPAQVLANAVFQLEYCERLLEKEPDRLRQELANLKRDVKEGLAEVRNFIFDLRPAPLAEIGLQAMLRHYAENYESRFDIEVETDLSDVGRLPAAQETAIYRIVQEALQNAQKHSHASKIKIALGQNDHSVVVSVEDNGVGFDVQAQLMEQLGHFGLTSMRERSRLIGGELEIISAPEKGTKVVLTVPLVSDATDA